MNWSAWAPAATLCGAFIAAVAATWVARFNSRRHGRWESIKNDLEIAKLIEDDKMKAWIQNYARVRVKAYGLSETGPRTYLFRNIAAALLTVLGVLVFVWLANRMFSTYVLGLNNADQLVWNPFSDRLMDEMLEPGSSLPADPDIPPGAILNYYRPLFPLMLLPIFFIVIGLFVLPSGKAYALRGVRRSVRNEVKPELAALHSQLENIEIPRSDGVWIPAESSD
ncbi:hypothetical protein ACFYVR_23480 [Rhodococcus sp. NPDC003318]|uniref:hypothetical protein n=1 Tax=Rhodococcus sp. NPDC003318 TaxID=3364503 RepID=UPI0036747405